MLLQVSLFLFVLFFLEKNWCESPVFLVGRSHRTGRSPLTTLLEFFSVLEHEQDLSAKHLRQLLNAVQCEGPIPWMKPCMTS